MRAPQWFVVLAAGVVSVGLWSGCGAPNGAAPRIVADQFSRAIADDNGAEACALMAPATRAELEQSAGASCASAIVEENLPDAGTLEAPATFGTMAQVSFDSDVIFLAEFARGWRVMAAGCFPSSTPRKPYQCQLRGVSVRVLFITYLAVIIAGLCYFIVIAALHT